jgi:hypothetical protein
MWLKACIVKINMILGIPQRAGSILTSTCAFARGQNHVKDIFFSKCAEIFERQQQMKITCSASPLGKLTAPPTTEKKIPNVLWG